MTGWDDAWLAPADVARFRRPPLIRKPSPEYPACWSWPQPAAIPLDEDDRWHAMLAWCRGRGGPVPRSWPRSMDTHCALCGMEMGAGYLVNDHDHESGLFRGRICNPCNVQEGCNRSKPIHVRWRRINPATIWHIKILMSFPEVPRSADEIEAAAEQMRRVIDGLSG